MIKTIKAKNEEREAFNAAVYKLQKDGWSVIRKKENEQGLSAVLEQKAGGTIRCFSCGKVIDHVELPCKGATRTEEATFIKHGKFGVGINVPDTWAAKDSENVGMQRENILCPECGKFPFKIPCVYTHSDSEAVCYIG